MGIRTLIIDDHTLFAESLSIALNSSYLACSVVVATSAQQALTIVEMRPEFELVLVDLNIPDTRGFDLVANLQTRCTGKVVVLSADISSDLTARAQQLGTAGYISKLDAVETLLENIERVLHGDAVFPAHITSSPENPSPLSFRQIEFVKLLAKGQSNAAMSLELKVGLNTVKFHLKNIFSILGVHNRTSCVSEALRRGLLSQDDF